MFGPHSVKATIIPKTKEKNVPIKDILKNAG